MSIKYFLGFLTLIIVVSVAAWLSVLFFINPESGIKAVLLFYSSLFLLLTALITIIGYGLRSFLKRSISHKKSLEAQNSFRQAIFLSLIFIFALSLQAKGLLNWFNIIVLVGAVTAVEFLIITRENRKHSIIANEDVQSIETIND